MKIKRQLIKEIKIKSILDKNIYNYDLLFDPEISEMTKGEKLTYRQSFPNHAMVFIGYNKDNNHK